MDSFFPAETQGVLMDGRGSLSSDDWVTTRVTRRPVEQNRKRNRSASEDVKCYIHEGEVEQWIPGAVAVDKSDSFDVKDAVEQNVRTSIFSSFRNRSKRGGIVHLGPKHEVLCPDRRR